MKQVKKRLDVLMVEQGLAPSREKAKALIMAGQVYCQEEKCDKAGMTLPEDAILTVKGQGLKYVSRGGLKLEKGIREFGFDLSGCVCMDIGASTGGFTDCMLQNGAKRVYAIDVGYGQLAWSLRSNDRVVNLERTNVRYLTREQVPEDIDFASVDVSFISLTLVLPVLFSWLKETGQALILVKPQFEAGREKVGKKGVVRDPKVHLEVCQKIYRFCLEQQVAVEHVTFSPIKGPEGNIEYLFHLNRTPGVESVPESALDGVVKQSHETLEQGKQEA